YSGSVETATATPRLGDDRLDLISLLAAGLNDKTIFMQQGISRRTHQKHVAELMQALNARTRFQAGWLAALKLQAAGEMPGSGHLPNLPDVDKRWLTREDSTDG